MPRALHLLCVVAVFLGNACSTELRHGLTEDAANEIVVALDEAGIAANKVRAETAKEDSWIVKVPKGDATRAWRTIKERELPRRRDVEFAEVFQKGSMIPSATEERALFLHALSGKLANMLRTAPGVVDARVHVALEESRGPFGPDKARPVSASVVIKERRSEGARELDTAAVQRLVAAGVSGLRAESVEVMRVDAAPSRATGSESQSMTQVGPFSVSRASAVLLSAVLWAGALTVVSLAGLLLWMVLRGRRLGDRRDERTSGAEP